MHTKIVILAMVASLLSCNQQMDKKSKEAAEEGLRNSEIKRVSEAEILEQGFVVGRMIADTAQMALGSTLKTTVQNEGVEAALKYCNVAAYPLLEQISNRYDAEIRRVSLRLRNQNDAPDRIEKEILEAYQYSLDEGLELSDNVQRIGDDYLLYTKPIMLGDPVCLQCHGKLGAELTESTLKTIRDLYPEDNATEHSLGDLRGMWSIKLSKKELIKSL